MVWISYLNFKAVLVLPKTAGSAQTHKSISFIWIVWSTLYVYLWPLLAIKRKTKSVVILQLVDMKPIFRNIFFSFLNFAVSLHNSKTNENFPKGQCHVVLALRDNDCVAAHIKQERLIFCSKNCPLFRHWSHQLCVN